MLLAGLGAAALAMSGPQANAGAAIVSGPHIVSLGQLPGGTHSSAYDINNRGVIVGSSQTATGGDHAVRWDPDGRITDLGTLPGGDYSHAEAINDRGYIVGEARTADGSDHAVRWAPDGTITDLDALNGQRGSRATGINDRGYAIGFTWIPNGISHAVRWRPDGTGSDLGTNSPLKSTMAFGINDHGVVTGVTTEGAEGAHYHYPLTWADGSTTGVVLPPLPNDEHRGSAVGINDKGLVVGYSQIGHALPMSLTVHATVWSPGAAVPTDLGGLPGGDFSSYANDVNDEADIVGSAVTNRSYDYQAILWEREKSGWRLVPLPQLPGGTWSEAKAIGDDGEVVGTAHTAQGLGVAVRWER
ncbi:hypothetical protein [Actinomadura roseirufa]|uniref:hypothetical protein n=1 Tax=Actinomadura roseirufa TaxID=2094049 RepID=UPI0013F15FC6|nr:hypothetical protein [Actinomadura roseirufa]